MSIFVSRSLDYALRSLIELARHPGGSPLSLRELSETARVPRSYLAKLMSTLVKGGLVVSDAGAHGGYRLARAAADIDLLKIYETVEGNFRTVLCGHREELCDLHEDCTQVSVWVMIEREMAEVLTRRTLADFVEAAPGGFVPVDRVEMVREGGPA